MERIWISKDGGKEYTMYHAQMDGDVPTLKIGDNYFAPIANGAIVQRLGLGKLTPQMIVQRPELWLHLGTNEGGRIVLTEAEYREIAKAREAEEAALRARTARIYLSSRGWGDYSACEWVGDITRPDTEILAECRKALAEGHDVDVPNQSDEEILGKIAEARKQHSTSAERKAAAEAEEAEDIQRKVSSGYCFNCETWCHGACGHYSNDPRVKFNRDIKEAQREATYGISEEA